MCALLQVFVLCSITKNDLLYQHSARCLPRKPINGCIKCNVLYFEWHVPQPPAFDIHCTVVPSLLTEHLQRNAGGMYLDSVYGIHGVE